MNEINFESCPVTFLRKRYRLGEAILKMNTLRSYRNFFIITRTNDFL